MTARWTWRSRVATALLALACGACDRSGSGPTSPSSSSFSFGDAPAYPAPGPDPVATPRAVVVITSFEARTAEPRSGPQNSLVLLPTATLQETSGGGAVAIDDLYIVFPSGHWDKTSRGNCFGGRWNIVAGGTWASENNIPYCWDAQVPVDLAGKQVRLTVVYRDDDGNVGRVSTYAIAGAAGGR